MALPERSPRYAFSAMASPWEVHVTGADSTETASIGVAVEEEVRRIELKYSRYRPDSVIQRINNAGGAAVQVDSETARLLDYADELWRHSEGLFDITTGALRRAWIFDGSDRVPGPEKVNALLSMVGWDKVTWEDMMLQLRPGMEIDFGGIGKEYAVDRALTIARGLTTLPVLVNGGGDLAASAPPAPGEPWQVGIDPGFAVSAPSFRLFRGAAATSGDAQRYLLKNGIRYSHVLNPRSGWPVEAAAHSITVLADSCTEAGSFATVALLKGSGSEAYLQEQNVKHWVLR